ncbi:acyl-CoA thioesterase, partial [Actinomadura adrarensis]
MTEIDAPPHPFDAAIALGHTPDGRIRSRTRPEYANMVGPFGGITAAILLQAVQEHPDLLGEPLSLTVNYSAPVADGDFDITARAVRTNRTNQHWMLELSQDGVIKTTATAVTGIRRETWSDTELQMPSVPAPEDVPEQSFADVTAWAANYDMRFVEGYLPDLLGGADEQPDSTSTLWVRDSPSRPLDAPA